MPSNYQSVQAGLNPAPLGAPTVGAGQVSGFQNQGQVQQGSGMLSNITNALGLQAGGKKTKSPKKSPKPSKKKGGEQEQKQQKQQQDGGKKKAKPKRATSPKRTTSPKRAPKKQ